MGRRLRKFPGDGVGEGQRRYPWAEWTDGSPWQIRQGDDYDVATENMRVNLHLKASALLSKVRTKKFTDDDGEGLFFQFLKSEDEETVQMITTENPEAAQTAMQQLYEDALEIYERARQEVTIPRKDGTRQAYAAIRYRTQIERGFEENALVPAVARIVRKPTLGFSHLDEAERPDLMLETLVLDTTKPYHGFFSSRTRQVAKDRMDDYRRRHSA